MTIIFYSLQFNFVCFFFGSQTVTQPEARLITEKQPRFQRSRLFLLLLFIYLLKVLRLKHVLFCFCREFRVRAGDGSRLLPVNFYLNVCKTD